MPPGQLSNKMWYPLKLSGPLWLYILETRLSSFSAQVEADDILYNEAL